MLRAADPTEAGLDWAMVPSWPSRMLNYSHGTAGLATALDDGGFIVPLHHPALHPDVEPVTDTWCHGPTGTSYLFAALAHAGVAEVAGLEVTAVRRAPGPPATATATWPGSWAKRPYPRRPSAEGMYANYRGRSASPTAASPVVSRS